MIVDCVKKVTEEGIDTSDATATAADILSGKSAYVNDEKIVGELVPHTTTIDGVEQDMDLEFESRNIRKYLPFLLGVAHCCTLDNELHVFGPIKLIGEDVFSNNRHYKWDGTNWIKLANLPNDVYSNDAFVVYADYIHWFNNGRHFKIANNGSIISNASTMPYSGNGLSAVVYNNEIHILGSDASDYSKYHYKWNGSTWVSVSTLPYMFGNGSAVVLNNEIHILGGGNTTDQDESKYTKHYKWNGSTWVSVSTLPYKFGSGSAVVYNNEIHIIGSAYSGNVNHYKWNGSSWIKCTMPYDAIRATVGIYNNEMHILGCNNNDVLERFHYFFDSSINANDFIAVSLNSLICKR